MLGVSPDGEASHEKFKAKYDLPFTLLADTDHAVADAYGVWGEKSYAGKTYMGVKRSTFVIGADGNVVRVFHNVKPAEHADQVLEALSTTAAEPRGRARLTAQPVGAAKLGTPRMWRNW